jgi:hypothetical protein
MFSLFTVDDLEILELLVITTCLEKETRHNTYGKLYEEQPVVLSVQEVCYVRFDNKEMRPFFHKWKYYYTREVIRTATDLCNIYKHDLIRGFFYCIAN